MIEINGKTQLVGLFGWPVSHSFSPAMHNAAATALGLNWVYLPMAVHPDDVETAVRSLPALGFRGINITVPHKQTILPFLDAISTGAKALKAVNTIVVEWPTTDNGKRLSANEAGLVGYNTDWSGFMADLDELGIDVSGRDCIVIGAGGSARAVAYGLGTVGGRVQVLSRRIEQAEKLVADLRPFFVDGVLQERPLTQLSDAVANCTAPLIVNTTPVGMSPNIGESPWPQTLEVPDNAIIYDLVYNPAQTSFMQQAEAAGCRAINGLGMLVHQGALAFQLWTGKMPNVQLMRETIMRLNKNG
ncbi:MAG: shikimate dehydrogenase [Chloroflexi bacterium]|nr:shikimate dehydrogenase [Chloroflexota bacterium]